MYELNLVPVAMWRYEQAFCTEIVCVFARDDDWEYQHREWTQKFGHSMPDNKVTFKCVLDRWTRGEKREPTAPIYVTFHDDRVYLGLGVRPYRGDELAEPESRKEKQT